MGETPNPLIAQERQSQGQVFTGGTTDNGCFAGIGLVEGPMDLYNTIRQGSWVMAGVAGAGTLMEGVSLAIDPVSTLLAYGFSWLIEHIRPLQEMLDSIAGDPDGVKAFGETWKRIAESLKATADRYKEMVANDTKAWNGAAAEEYRRYAAHKTEAIMGASYAAAGLGDMVLMMGEAVAFVRELVREIISQCISRIITYACEAVFSFGLATPVVIAQASTFVANVITKVGELFAKLNQTIKEAWPLIHKLASAIGKCVLALLKPIHLPTKIAEPMAVGFWGKVNPNIVALHDIKHAATHKATPTPNADENSREKPVSHAGNADGETSVERTGHTTEKGNPADNALTQPGGKSAEQDPAENGTSEKPPDTKENTASPEETSTPEPTRGASEATDGSEDGNRTSVHEAGKDDKPQESGTSEKGNSPEGSNDGQTSSPAPQDGRATGDNSGEEATGSRTEGNTDQLQAGTGQGSPGHPSSPGTDGNASGSTPQDGSGPPKGTHSALAESREPSSPDRPGGPAGRVGGATDPAPATGGNVASSRGPSTAGYSRSGHGSADRTANSGSSSARSARLAPEDARIVDSLDQRYRGLTEAEREALLGGPEDSRLNRSENLELNLINFRFGDEIPEHFTPHERLLLYKPEPPAFRLDSNSFEDRNPASDAELREKSTAERGINVKQEHARYVDWLEQRNGPLTKSEKDAALDPEALRKDWSTPAGQELRRIAQDNKAAGDALRKNTAVPRQRDMLERHGDPRFRYTATPFERAEARFLAVRNSNRFADYDLSKMTPGEITRIARGEAPLPTRPGVKGETTQQGQLPWNPDLRWGIDGRVVQEVDAIKERYPDAVARLEEQRGPLSPGEIKYVFDGGKIDRGLAAGFTPEFLADVELTKFRHGYEIEKSERNMDGSRRILRTVPLEEPDLVRKFGHEVFVHSDKNGNLFFQNQEIPNDVSVRTIAAHHDGEYIFVNDVPATPNEFARIVDRTLTDLPDDIPGYARGEAGGDVTEVARPTANAMAGHARGTSIDGPNVSAADGPSKKPLRFSICETESNNVLSAAEETVRKTGRDVGSSSTDVWASRDHIYAAESHASRVSDLSGGVRAHFDNPGHWRNTKLAEDGSVETVSNGSPYPPQHLPSHFPNDTDKKFGMWDRPDDSDGGAKGSGPEPPRNGTKPESSSPTGSRESSESTWGPKSNGESDAPRTREASAEKPQPTTSVWLRDEKPATKDTPKYDRWGADPRDPVHRKRPFPRRVWERAVLRLGPVRPQNPPVHMSEKLAAKLGLYRHLNATRTESGISLEPNSIATKEKQVWGKAEIDPNRKTVEVTFKNGRPVMGGLEYRDPVTNERVESRDPDTGEIREDAVPVEVEVELDVADFKSLLLPGEDVRILGCDSKKFLRELSRVHDGTVLVGAPKSIPAEKAEIDSTGNIEAAQRNRKPGSESGDGATEVAPWDRGIEVWRDQFGNVVAASLEQKQLLGISPSLDKAFARAGFSLKNTTPTPWEPVEWGQWEVLKNGEVIAIHESPTPPSQNGIGPRTGEFFHLGRQDRSGPRDFSNDDLGIRNEADVDHEEWVNRVRDFRQGGGTKPSADGTGSARQSPGEEPSQLRPKHAETRIPPPQPNRQATEDAPPDYGPSSGGPPSQSWQQSYPTTRHAPGGGPSGQSGQPGPAGTPPPGRHGEPQRPAGQGGYGAPGQHLPRPPAQSPPGPPLGPPSRPPAGQRPWNAPTQPPSRQQPYTPHQPHPGHTPQDPSRLGNQPDAWTSTDNTHPVDISGGPTQPLTVQSGSSSDLQSSGPTGTPSTDTSRVDISGGSTQPIPVRNAPQATQQSSAVPPPPDWNSSADTSGQRPSSHGQWVYGESPTQQPQIVPSDSRDVPVSNDLSQTGTGDSANVETVDPDTLQDDSPHVEKEPDASRQEAQEEKSTESPDTGVANLHLETPVQIFQGDLESAATPTDGGASDVQGTGKSSVNTALSGNAHSQPPPVENKPHQQVDAEGAQSVSGGSSQTIWERLGVPSPESAGDSLLTDGHGSSDGELTSPNKGSQLDVEAIGEFEKSVREVREVPGDFGIKNLEVHEHDYPATSEVQQLRERLGSRVDGLSSGQIKALELIYGPDLKPREFTPEDHQVFKDHPGLVSHVNEGLPRLRENIANEPGSVSVIPEKTTSGSGSPSEDTDSTLSANDSSGATSPGSSDANNDGLSDIERALGGSNPDARSETADASDPAGGSEASTQRGEHDSASKAEGANEERGQLEDGTRTDSDESFERVISDAERALQEKAESYVSLASINSDRVSPYCVVFDDSSRGSYKLRDVPGADSAEYDFNYPKREISCSRIAELVGCDDMVATSTKWNGPYGEGSLTEWIEGGEPGLDPANGWLIDSYDPYDRQRLAAYDYLVGNIDRADTSYFRIPGSSKPRTCDQGQSLMGNNEVDDPFPNEMSNDFVWNEMGALLDRRIVSTYKNLDEVYCVSMLQSDRYSESEIDSFLERLEELRKGVITGEAWRGEIIPNSPDLL